MLNQKENKITFKKKKDGGNSKSLVNTNIFKCFMKQGQLD